MNFKEGITRIGIIILAIYGLLVSVGFWIIFVDNFNENFLKFLLTTISEFFKFELSSFFNRVGIILKSTGIYLLVLVIPPAIIIGVFSYIYKGFTSKK